MRWVLLGILQWALVTFAIAADWVPLSGGHISSPQGSLNLKIDKESIVRDSDTVTLWFQMWWGPGGTVQQYNSTFDCKRRQSNTNYSFQFAMNDPSRRYEGSPSGFTPVAPSSASEVVFNAICSKKWYELWK
jgi:hypothetical protein